MTKYFSKNGKILLLQPESDAKRCLLEKLIELKKYGGFHC